MNEPIHQTSQQSGACPDTSALNSLPVGACVVDDALCVRAWNTTLVQWTGIPSEEMIGTLLTERYPDLARPTFARRLADAISGGTPAVLSAALHPHVFPVPRTIGSKSELMVQKTHLRPFGETGTLGLIVIEDVSLQFAQLEQLRHEQQRILSSERELRAVLNTAPSSIIQIDAAGIIRSANPTSERLFGYTTAEMVGQNIKMLMPSPFREHHDGYLRHYAETGDAKVIGTQREVWAQRKSGEVFPVQLSVGESSENGKRFFTGVAIDLTERREYETNLARLSGIVESSDDAIFSENLDGVITYWNEAAEHLFGFSHAEAIGQPATLLVPADHTNEEHALFERAKRGERTESFDSVRCRKDGSCVDVSLNISPIKDFQGTVVAVSTIARDVTERKLAVAQLQAAQHQAEEANLAKSEFLANMSHEIRTPMTAILGFSDVLLSTLKDTEHADSLRTIQRNGRHLIEIINDILDLSKIEAGRLDVERLECSPVEIVSEVAALMRIRASDEGLPLSVEFRGKIAERIHTDPTRLRQILMNLIGNAIKFTEVGEVQVVVRMSSLDADSPHPPALHVDVIDSGIGMTPEQLDRLFQPFTQADASTTRKYGGTGLGLTICQRLATVLGGNITVESQPKHGSTFTMNITTGSLEGVTLLENVSETVRAAQEDSEPQPDGDQPAHGRVLLAEDGPDNRRLIGFLLKKMGMAVDMAENGRIAVDRALAAQQEGNPYDMILMDMQMPELDGYSATGVLRDLGFDRPIVAITAHAMAGDREKCIAAGCTDYLTKPIDRQRLHAIVSKYTGTAVTG